MGFNFSGVAISQKKKEDILDIQDILGTKLTFSKEIYFDEALSWHKEDNEFDLYFAEKGVLVFTSEPLTILEKHAKSKGIMITTFGASETSMAFMITAFENGERFRDLMEFNLDKLEDNGQKFEGETETDDGFEVVTKAISHTIGHNFWSIEPSEKAYRYVVG